MPAAPSEPEKYSIDEMMERLKGQVSDKPASTGALITRADGTQAIRVRKRKRRTEQPAREEAKHLKRSRMLQVAIALVLLLLAGLLVGGAYVYANTSPYRKSLTNAIANSTGAKVEIKLFRVSPASANADSVVLEWPEGNVLKSIRLHGVAAKISPLSLFGTGLRGDEVAVRDGDVFLQTPTGETPVLAAPEHATNMPVRFNRIAVPRCNITLGDPGQPALKILASEASLRLDKPNNQTSLLLYRGSVQVAGWPALKIDRSVMSFHEAETELVLLRINDSRPKRGVFDLAGHLRPYASDARTSLSVKLDAFDFGELLGTQFGELIDATIDTRPEAGSNSLSFAAGSLASADLNIAFKNTLSTKVSIKGFPFLLSLVRTLNDRWYENPSFGGEATGIIHRNGAIVELRDLRLENRSRMAVKADLTSAADGSLTGSMSVGIPESVAETSPYGKIHAMLGPAREGFRWLTLKIGGTLAHPNDDFSVLYAAAKDNDPPDESEDPKEPAKGAAPGDDPPRALENPTRPKDP